MAHLFLNFVSPQTVPRPIYFSQEYLYRTLDQDCSLLERIVAAFHRAVEEDSTDTQSAVRPLWSETGYLGRQSDLIASLKRGDVPALHEQLRQMFISNAVYALGMSKEEAEIIRSNPNNLRNYGLQWVDRLVALAHAVGVLPVPYPETDPKAWASALEIDVDAVVLALETRLGISLAFPDLGGVFGGEFRGGALPIHAFRLLAAAFQMTLLTLRSQPSILEIGGGFGGLAYWACKLLPCRYTIYDKPYVSAIQAYFLGRAFAPEKLVLYGEEFGPAADIVLYPAWKLLRPPAPAADMAVSQDSFNDIPPATTCGYLAALRAGLCGPLLSLNHEASRHHGGGPDLVSVPKLMLQVGGFELAQRSPFFLQAGFVQEVYYPRAHHPKYRRDSIQR